MDGYLKGGRESIYKHLDFVYRPTNNWTEHVHQYLIYLHNKGFNRVPFPYETSLEGEEKISYLEGDVFNELLPEEVRTDEVLISVCRLIREFHDLGSEYVKQLTGNEEWMLSTSTPIETMCHGDLAPYNIVMKGKEVVGVIDFDTLHPGSRIWDIAYALYRWVPLMSKDNPENFGSEDDKVRRLRLFIETYGLKDIEDDEVIIWVIKRIEYLIDFMSKEADRGDEVFEHHIQDGHLNQYLKDLEYIRNSWGK